MTHHEGLAHLFEDLIKDTYDAEAQILEALPKMQEAASSPDLKKAFKQHLDMTKSQQKRVDQVAKKLKIEVTGKHCKGMEGLIKEGQEVMKMKVPEEVKDAGLIAAAQKVEHYEIATYGTLRTYASMLGHEEAAQIFDQIAKEEGETDHMLTQLAESHINREAMEKGEKSKQPAKSK